MGNNQGKLFYGWVVVFAGVLLNFIGMGIIGVKGIFFPSMMETLNVSQTQASMVVTFVTLGTLIGGITAGKILSKLGARKVVLIFGLATSILVGLLGVVGSLTLIYFISTLVGICLFATSVVTVPGLITVWFEEKRGTAIGIAMAGTGLSQTILTPYLTPIIAKLGYKIGYLHLSVIMLIVTLVAVALIKNRPEDINLKSYGNNSGDKKSNKIKTNSNNDLSYDIDLKSAVKSPSFLFLIGFGVTTVFAGAGIMIQMPSYFIHKGISPSGLGLILAGAGLFSVLSKVVIGFVFDKLGVYKGNLIFSSLMMIAFISIYMIPSNLGIILFILFAGIGFGFAGVANPLMISKLFGSKYYSQIFSVYMLFFSLGAIISSVLSGFIIDKLGFTSLIVTGMILGASGALFSCLSLSLGKKQQEKLIIQNA